MESPYLGPAADAASSLNDRQLCHAVPALASLPPGLGISLSGAVIPAKAGIHLDLADRSEKQNGFRPSRE
jgi:hypothetical protein